MDYLNYDQLVDKALLGVVQQALRQISAQGLKGKHHFYITFLTRHLGVQIPAYLVEDYPDEMTIVLQHEFWNLKVEDDFFSVDVSFGYEPVSLKVPFSAIVHVSDPSTNFELEFNPEFMQKDLSKGGVSTGENIISLDQFRKK